MGPFSAMEELCARLGIEGKHELIHAMLAYNHGDWYSKGEDIFQERTIRSWFASTGLKKRPQNPNEKSRRFIAAFFLSQFTKRGLPFRESWLTDPPEKLRRELEALRADTVVEAPGRSTSGAAQELMRTLNLASGKHAPGTASASTLAAEAPLLREQPRPQPAEAPPSPAPEPAGGQMGATVPLSVIAEQLNRTLAGNRTLQTLALCDVTNDNVHAVELAGRTEIGGMPFERAITALPEFARGFDFLTPLKPGHCDVRVRDWVIRVVPLHAFPLERLRGKAFFFAVGSAGNIGAFDFQCHDAVDDLLRLAGKGQ